MAPLLERFVQPPDTNSCALSHESKEEHIYDSPSMLLSDFEEKEWSWTSAQQNSQKKLSHLTFCATNLLFLAQWQLTFASFHKLTSRNH
jgi:hypothetical protein